MHFSIFVECSWRRGIIECPAPHVRAKIELGFYALICLQVLSQTWQVPLQSNIIQQSVICHWHFMSAFLSSVFLQAESLSDSNTHMQILPVPVILKKLIN